MVSTESHTRVLLSLFRLDFGSVWSSAEAAWKVSSGRSVVLGISFVAGVST